LIGCDKNDDDYKLRPNFLIAMTVAPQLFNKENAIKALLTVESHLLVKNGLGIRTLGLKETNYNGNYVNSNDSTDFNTAHGLNYHNVNYV
jgi:glycogen debranching enzyme